MPLYPYQERVKALIQAGRSVILQAPTGAGKTRAALSPFIENFFDRPAGSVPRKCIYCVPMRVLANQFVSAYEKYAKDYKQNLHRQIAVTIQTGEQPKDQDFRGDLIFCTVDQLLSSVLTMPYGLPNRKANLNAGAAVGSYLVFDEFHLLDPESTLPTAWYAIKQYSQVAPVLLMTATFSRSMLDSLAQELHADVVTVSAEEALQIEKRTPAPLPRQRTWLAAAEPLSAQAVLAEHRQRSLVLCNTVQRAQDLYGSLKVEIDARQLPVRLLMLHSRFLPEDRAQIERDLRCLFGKGENSDAAGSVIAIATQAIEVGVDITSEVLHTELAPASALIQRAGRCARYPGEQGKVIVYPVENYAPYAMDQDGKAWKQEMEAAAAWIAAHSGEFFDYAKEQDLVNAVATPRDCRVVAGLLNGRAGRAQDIQRVLLGDRTPGDGRLLIRDASSCRVLIHPQPNDLLENPYSATGFNLQPSTLFGLFKNWQQRAEALDLDWVARVLVDPPGDDRDTNVSNFRWERLDTSMIPGARVVVVNPALAGYDSEQGFLPAQGGSSFISTLPLSTAEAGRQSFSGYRLESYEEHVERVLQAFQREVLPELTYPAQALERAAGWREGVVLDAAWLVCLLHDVGKLSTGWQGWARAHQQAVGSPVSADFAPAHTDTNNDDEAVRAAAQQALRANPRPNHAVEGAAATAALLFGALQQPDVVRAAITAIARHHAPFSRECNRFTLESRAAQHIAATLDFLPPQIRKTIQLAALQTSLPPSSSFATTVMVQPAQTWPWLAYTLLVRAVRTADPIGTRYGSSTGGVHDLLH